MREKKNTLDKHADPNNCTLKIKNRVLKALDRNYIDKAGNLSEIAKPDAAPFHLPEKLLVTAARLYPSSSERRYYNTVFMGHNNKEFCSIGDFITTSFYVSSCGK